MGSDDTISLEDKMRAEVEGDVGLEDEKKEELGRDRQSCPSVLGDVGKDVEIINIVSPLKFPNKIHARKVVAAR